MRPVHITDTTLRDAHQSLWATRMTLADMLPIRRRWIRSGTGRGGLGWRDL